MGKNKGQRTKNNAKPSNSGRSAERLETKMPNFVGFSAIKDGGCIPILPGLEISALNGIEINTINSDFQLVFKQMNKKDSTTKFKALREFTCLCKNSELPLVEAVIPFWPRFYSILAVDIEHRVREAAQFAHATLVKKVGRNLALCLKLLASTWFTSQFDTYPPAASIATNSFQETFPNQKMIDAIVYCQEEILSYIADNINGQVLESMNTHNIGNLTPEELQTKYQRLVICCLQGYCYYLNKVPLQQIEKAFNIHEKIITNKNFWKLAYHESPLIKMAFYNVLSSIIANAKILLGTEMKRAVTVIMNNLDEKDPETLEAVWESMIVAIDQIDNWYRLVSIEKLVLPKLWKILRNGGHGCATVIYPNLLPLLSQFPKFNVENQTILFMDYFDNMRQSFSIDTVQKSHSQMAAITKSFIECLRYTIHLKNDDIKLCETLIKEQLIPVIEYSIKAYSIVKIIVFNEVTELIRYLSKNRDSTEYNSYSLLVSTFWNELELILQRLIDDTSECSDKSTLFNIHNGQIKLLFCLKSSSELIKKTVKFGNNIEQIEQHDLKKTNLVNKDPQYFKELNDVATKLCITYFKNINIEKSMHTTQVDHLNQLVSNFDSKDLFLALARADGNDNNLLKFCLNSLRNWLTRKYIEIKAVIQFNFTIFKYMSNGEKNEVLKFLTELNDYQVLNSSIINALSTEYRDDKAIEYWRKGVHVTEHLKEIARKLVADRKYIESDVNLLIMAFESIDGDLTINEEAIDGVANILSEILSKFDPQFSEKIIYFISSLLNTTWQYKKLTAGSVQMLKALFQLNIRQSLSSNLTELIQRNSTNGFIIIREKLTSNELFEIQRDFMKIIYEELYLSNGTIIHSKIDIILNFIESSSCDYQSALKMITKFNCIEKNLLGEWISEISGVVLHAELLSGNFYMVNPIQSLPLNGTLELILPKNEKLPNKMTECLQWALFNTKILIELLSKFCKNITDNEINLNVKDCLSDFSQIVMIASLGNLYCKHYKFTKNYNCISKIMNLLEYELLNRVPRCILKKIPLESLNVDEYWMKYGSVFSQFLQYIYGDEAHLSEVKLKGEEIMKKYVESEDSSLTYSDHINVLVLARNLLDEDKHYSLCSQVLLKIIRRHEYDRDFLLFNRDIDFFSWPNCCFVLEVIRLFTKFVNTAPSIMNPEMWDATMLFLSSWQLSLNRSKHSVDDLKMRYIVVAVSQLFSAIQGLMNKNQDDNESKLSTKLVDEWKNVFSDDSNRQMANLWITYVTLFNRKIDYLTPILVISYLGNSTLCLDANTLFESYSDYTSIIVDSDKVIEITLQLLLSALPLLQLIAHNILNRLVPKLVEQDKNLIEKENFDSKLLNIHKLTNTLLDIRKIIDTLLLDFKQCNMITYKVEPFTDCYMYTFAYFLAWINVLDMCHYASSTLRFQYGEILKDALFPSLMNNIFRLMPAELLQDHKFPIPKFQNLFKIRPSLDFDECLTQWSHSHTICWVYANALRQLPVLTRQWWNTTDYRVSNSLEKITKLYISPMLCHEELINKTLNNVVNMEVKIYPITRSVGALYRMDDAELELMITLPNNHPLGLIDVSELKQHAGGAANWKNCEKQLSIFLNHQNGSIWDGLLMWKNNLDKKFSGVEECYICFSIFHINTNQIPKLSCHTCRKKFHAPCLYKWFSTSQKSTCPICRNIF